MAAADWDRLAAWVTGGGVLVMAAEESLGRELFERRLGVVDEIGFDFELTAQIDTASPFFNRPIVEGSFEFPVTRQGYLVAEDDDYVVHLSRGGRPVLISKQIGAGQVFLTTYTHLFTNDGLNGQGNREVALNFLNLVPQGGQIWFSEWHHGLHDVQLTLTDEELVGPMDWLRFTSPGRAVLFSLLAIFAFIALGGRHLGRPNRLPESLVRRGPAEYVEAVSRLIRESQDTDVVADHYYHHLRRHLIKAYRLSPDHSDERLVKEAGRRDQKIDTQALYNLLNGFRQKGLSEMALVQQIAELEKFVE